MILADTHAWIFFLADRSRLSPVALEALETAAAKSALMVSAVSVWEVAWLERRGRLVLQPSLEAWLADAQSLPFLDFLPVDFKVAHRAGTLPPVHRDPIDRFILATAQIHNLPVVSADRQFPAYPDVQVVW